VQDFNVQLLALVEAYMDWMLQLGEDGYSGEYTLPPNAEVESAVNICEVDVYRASYKLLCLFSLIFY
jgi:hypothetical protein